MKIDPSAMPSDTGIEELVVGDLPCWRLYSPKGEVLVARQGAQVLRYTPAGQRPVVWLSETAEFAPGQPLRGGVPVCWPWFGALERNPAEVRAMLDAGGEAPAHGLVRSLDWYLAGFGARAEAALMRLRVDLPTGVGAWKHAAELTLEIHLDDALALTLSTHNRGAQTIAVSQALHTYFAVSDSRQVQVDGLDDCEYVETLEGWEMRRQSGPVELRGETDRIYTGVNRPMVIRDRDWQRQIRLDAFGSHSAVVWNPWVDKSLRLSQFPPDAWQRMLCIETANVWDDIIHVAPGTTSALGVRIQAQPLKTPS
jgi:glucose-6-phosphate 1-epimerase